MPLKGTDYRGFIDSLPHPLTPTLSPSIPRVLMFPPAGRLVGGAMCNCRFVSVCASVGVFVWVRAFIQNFSGINEILNMRNLSLKTEKRFTIGLLEILFCFARLIPRLSFS